VKIKLLIGCLLGVAVTGVALAQSPEDDSTLVAVMSVEETWLESERSNNTDLLAPLLADNVVDTTTEGKLLNGKEAVIADAKSVKWSAAEYRNIQVAVHGDTAIAPAVFKGKGVDTAGKPVNVLEQFTDVWVKAPSGKWQCVATHGTLIKQPSGSRERPAK
jgi:ketosteroid isomerase-like protein